MFRFFFFNDTATTEIYTLSLHDALPILAFLISDRGTHFTAHEFARCADAHGFVHVLIARHRPESNGIAERFVRTLKEDRKSTRLNSSHANISYAVFCLKKKNKQRDYTSH